MSYFTITLKILNKEALEIKIPIKNKKNKFT
jgi:hypothetical protein